ncbi:PKD domain-containing protein [bacterium]|nr:PKD domain-containing protein [bacterium]
MAVLSGCGGGSAVPLAERTTTGFALDVLEGSYVGCSSVPSVKLDICESADTTTVALAATHAGNLKALYFALDYDATRLHPVAVEAGELAGTGELLRLDVLDQPGQVVSGQVLAGLAAAAGFTGDGVLATVTFKSGAAKPVRQASLVPEHELSRTTLTGDDANNLRWRYFSRGDYNLDKLVYVSDLTPLGQNYQASGPWDENSALHGVDGNADGMITVNDITPIGQNFNVMVNGYNIYQSTDQEDYPQEAAGANGAGAGLVGSIVFEDRTVIEDERPEFVYNVAAPVTGAVYWVRPTDGTDDGIASNIYAFGGVTFSVDEEPGEGDGSSLYPYMVATNDEIQLVVTHPDLGDVTTAAETALTPSNTLLGTVDAATGILTIADQGQGVFYVGATYDAVGTIPDKLHFRVVDATVPLLTFLNPPDSGLGIEDDPYIVNIAETYEFSLMSLLAGDVTTDELTTWAVSNAGVGTVVKGATTARLNIENAFTGTFSVSAAYNGVTSLPEFIWLRVPGSAPTLTLTSPPSNGDGTELYPWEVQYPDGSPPELTFRVYSTEDGDVSTSTETIWGVSDAAAGSFTAGTSTLVINDDYEDICFVSALYKGEQTLPPRVWLELINVGDTVPPEADITADPATSDVTPVEITLDASGSTDTDGTVVSYDWDFDGDGEWDIEDDTESSIDHMYAGTGIFEATVRVWDNDNATDTASVTVTITDGGNFWPTALLTADQTTGEVPLTVHFDASGSSDPETEDLHYVWDLDGDGSYETDGGTTPTISHQYTTPVDIWVSVKVFDDEDAWDYDELELVLTSGGNLPPEAVLAADPTFGNPPPLNVNFNAGDSIDTDGTIEQYRWDFDGDGSYDETGTSATTVHQYNSAGIYNAVVEVTDDDGATDTDTVKITVVNDGASWHLIKVDETAGDIIGVGDYSSLKVVDGYPAIAYQIFDNSSADRKRAAYVRALDADGATWGTPVIVESPSQVQERAGIDIDLEIVDGNPAVVFGEYKWWYDGSDWHWYYRLVYERASDATGATWSGSRVNVAGGQGVGRGTHCDLYVVDGNPAATYFAPYDQTMYYCRATDSTGGTWAAEQLLDDGSWVTNAYSTGEYNSLCVIDGNPAVSYCIRVSDISAGYRLGFIRAADATGSSWNVPQSVDSAQQIAQGTSLLALTSGRAGIAYNDPVNDRMLFISASNLAATSWNTPIEVCATSGDFGAEDPSAVLYDGNPIVGYIDTAMFGADIEMSRATNAEGTTWQSAETVVDPSDCLDISTCVVNGKPAMSLHHDGEDALYFAIYY